MNKPEFRILWSNYDRGRFETVSINIESETGDTDTVKWFVLTWEQNDDNGYNYRRRWRAPLDEMLRTFGMQSYAQLADYYEGRYLNNKSAFVEIKAECDAKGVKLEYAS